MLRDLINHDSLPSVLKKKKKKLIRASHVFKDPPVFPHIGGKLCALTSENGTVQVHYVRRNTVHSLAVLFPRNSFKIYDTMYIRTRPHFECGFFPLSFSILRELFTPDLRRIDEGGKSVREIFGDKARRPSFKEEKFREIHFIRDVKTRVLTTARRLLLLLRVVF